MYGGCHHRANCVFVIVVVHPLILSRQCLGILIRAGNKIKCNAVLPYSIPIFQLPSHLALVRKLIQRPGSLFR